MAYPTNPGTSPMTAPPQPPSNNRKKIVVIATCIAVAFAIANGILIFKLTSDSSDDTASGNDSSSSQPASDDGSTDSATEEETAQPLAVAYTPPDGYEETSGYTLLSPLYPDYDEYFMINPDSDDPNESLFVVSYATDDTTADMSEDDQIAMAESYAILVGDSGDNDPETVDINGYPGVLDGITVPNASGDNITYASYYMFADNAMVQVGCQASEDTENGDQLAEDCTALASSVSW